MIEIKVDGPNDILHVKVDGKILDLLAEIPIAFGHVLGRILITCPNEKLRAEITKQVFENTLEEMEGLK